MKKFFGILGAIASVAGLAYLLIPKKEEITVSNLTWERGVDLEEFKEVEETSTTVPEGATVKHVSKRDKTVDGRIKQIICYTYVIKKWVTEGTCLSSGDNSETPYYEDSTELPEGRRYGKKYEKYYITDSNGNIWTTNYPRWIVLTKGERVTIKHNRFSSYISKIDKGGVF